MVGVELPDIKRSGLFVRVHLRKVGRDYTAQMWRSYGALVGKAGYKVPTYKSFHTLIQDLRLLGLIERDGTEAVGTVGPLPRVYYKLVKDKVKDPAWERPHIARWG